MADSVWPVNPPADARTQLLGLVACCSLSAFEQTASASARAPQVEQKLVLARLAAQRFSHLGRLEQALAAQGVSVADAMQDFVAPVDAFTQHTQPRDWGQALVKLCVVGGLVADFAAAAGPNLKPAEREILLGSIDDGELSQEPGQMLAQVLQSDPEGTGALALYGRRLLGEALSQVQRISASRPELTQALTGQHDGRDLAAMGDLMAGLSLGHARRMEQLGLQQ